MRPGIYHTVSDGETLWSIAGVYGLEVEEITEINRRIESPEKIRTGDRIYIPGARYPKSVKRAEEKKDFIWPVRGEIIKEFGRHGNKRHLGIGIKAQEGTPVVAAAGGRVVFVSEAFQAYGKTILLEHPGGYTTVYAHNREIFVEEGAEVEEGQKIAEVGMTGRTSQPHLYFEIRFGEDARNPLHYLGS